VRLYRPRTFVALAGFAVAAATVDLAGWMTWARATEGLAVNAERGAGYLAAGFMTALPSTVQRSRRLPVRELGSAPLDLAFAALMRSGDNQRRWMVAHPAGPTNLALGFLVAGDPVAALGVLDEALQRDPTSAHLHRLHALILMSRGEISAALESLAVAEALAPGLKEPEIELTPENQRSIHLRSLELRRELYPRRRMQTGLTLAREIKRGGDITGARATLEALGDHPEVVLEQAQWAVEDGDAPTAIELLDGRVTSRNVPRNLRARAWAILAVAREIEGDREGALSAAQQALDLDGRSPYAFLSLASLAESRGDYDTALEHLRRAWGMSPADVRLLIRIAGTAERAGKMPDAVLAMERAVELDPSSPDLAVRLVSLQLRQGDLTSAAMTLSEALDRHPTNASLLALADRLRRDVGIR